ncbi:MAG TPA: DMT family transporter [Coriobacteriia bacterium]|nr:DMT family transporter [Coriobacteriia bacterium]
MTDEQRPAPRTWIALAIALLLWASAFPGIRAGLAAVGATPGPDGYGPGELALLRFGTASIALVIYAFIVRLRLPKREDLPRVALAGLLGIAIYHVCLNFGERTVASGAAAVLIALSPVITAMLATRFLGERLSGWGWAGIAVSFAGGLLVAFGEGGGGLSLDPGALLILVATVSTSLYFFVSKPALKRYTALEFTSYAIWAGTIPMLFFAPTLVRQIAQAPMPATIAGVYLGIFPGAIAYVLWSYGLSKMPASRVSAFLYLQPVNAAIIAWFWLGEVPVLGVVIGGIVSIAGVVIVNTLGKFGPSPEETALAEDAAHA